MSKSRRTRRSRRGTSRIPRKRPSKFTGKNVIKTLIAFGPVAAVAAENAGKSGGLMSRTGWTKGVIPTLSTSYTGFNPNDGKFYPQDLVVGYAPLIGAMVFGKLARHVRLPF